jgi:CubicO group peptidase (beta-lactamase class C family)
MKLRIFFINLTFLFFSASLYGQDKAAHLQTLFDTLDARKNFNGCVLVAEKGKIIFEKAYGFADKETNRFLTTESVFELASVSKGFTAMAIMQMKEKGTLSYDDSLRKFFPELPYSGVSIRHLLTHTSGIPDFMGWSDKEIDFTKQNSNIDILKILPVKYRTTVHRPGSKFLYSNTNYLILASIIEKISGVSFSEYSYQNIFLPAGMTRTSVSPRDAARKLANYANDYLWDAGKNRFVKADSLERYVSYLANINGAYGISSNLGDLYKWDQVLSTDLLISEATKKEAFSPVKFDDSDEIITMGPGLPYVFGWQLLPDLTGGGDIFGSGNYGGYNTLIVRKVSKQQTVILLTNIKESTPVVDVMNSIDQILEGVSYTLPEPIVIKKSTVVDNEK